MPSLPDRLAAILAPHLEASLARSTPAVSRPPLLTPAAAAVSVSPAICSAGASSDVPRPVTDDSDNVAGRSTVEVNGRTPVSREGLLAALRAVAAVGGIKASSAKKSRGASRGGGHKETPLGKGLLAAIEVRCSGRVILGEICARTNELRTGVWRISSTFLFEG